MNIANRIADILGGMGQDETAPQIQMASGYVDLKALGQIQRHIARQWISNSKTGIPSGYRGSESNHREQRGMLPKSCPGTLFSFESVPNWSNS